MYTSQGSALITRTVTVALSSLRALLPCPYSPILLPGFTACLIISHALCQQSVDVETVVLVEAYSTVQIGIPNHIC